jgi:hypothetical protein
MVLTVLWLLVTTTFGLSQVWVGFLAHAVQSIASGSSFKFKESLSHSLNDLHLFVFSIATCGGIFISVGGAIYLQVVEGHFSGSSAVAAVIKDGATLIGSFMIIAISAVTWSLAKMNSGTQPLGSTTPTKTQSGTLVGMSIVAAGLSLVAGLITEMMK